MVRIRYGSSTGSSSTHQQLRIVFRYSYLQLLRIILFLVVAPELVLLFRSNSCFSMDGTDDSRSWTTIGCTAHPMLLQPCRSFSMVSPPSQRRVAVLQRSGGDSSTGSHRRYRSPIRSSSSSSRSIFHDNNNQNTTDSECSYSSVHFLMPQDVTTKHIPCQSLTRRTALLAFLWFQGKTTAQAATMSVSSDVSLSKQQQEDKSKLYQGLVRLNYLLDHWEEETTICGRSGDNPYISKNGCERTPMKVMDYLGYKDIQHPLFRAENTMRRLAPLVPTDRDAEYYDAMETWMMAAEAGNGLAYISSWGEANPGGGKDRVQLFLERARNSVLQARDNLSIIVNLLDVKQ